MERTDASESLFKEGFSCSQAVFAAFAPELELDKETALKIASSFGGGMAQMGEVCGAVTGALMALGLKYGRTKARDIETKMRNYELVQEFFKRFKERHSSIICKELLGLDMSVPEERTLIHERKLTATECPKFVETAARILENLM
ncbi:C_GCAxxG_C_C family protein [bacterium]|nr:C_GCAxxG_C_C family protein [bacterium]